VKKFNPNKNIIIGLLIAILVVAVVSLSAQRRASGGEITPIGTATNETVGFIDRMIATPGRFFSDIVDTVQDLKNAYEENIQLKQQLDNYEQLQLDNQNKTQQIAALKTELGLQATLASFEKTSANVITRSPDTWQDTLIIDKGSNDNIAVNMTVMSQSGVIGRIVQVMPTTSKVELLTATNAARRDLFPVRISSGGNNSFGLLSGYDLPSGLLVVNNVTGGTDFKEGDLVQTSGLGGGAPADLKIGTVVRVEKNPDGLQTNVYVKPAAQLYDISVVTVVERLAGSGE